MTRIWYCANCGYEVTARGRCHLCHERLVASALPELVTGGDEEEVGYRLDGWGDQARGLLIERLNDLALLHRFEDDELVVAADDESQVDDLVADVAAAAISSDGSGDDGYADGSGGGARGAGTGGDLESAEPAADPAMLSSLRLLADAARRLRADPTDMNADADVAEASTAVFMSDGLAGADPETWAAVGRVTRRLLGVLGADEALEAEIRSEAAVLERLLIPLVGRDRVGSHGSGGVGDRGDTRDTGDAAHAGETSDIDDTSDADDAGDTGDDTGDDTADDTADGTGDDDADDGEQTVYELPEWLPEQRARLGVMLDDAGIAFEWDYDDLVVPSDREAEVEEIFSELEGGGEEEEEGDDGGEARYQAIAELFAASGRLAADPADEERAAAVLQWIHESSGPAPFGMDQVYWLQIMSTARTLEATLQSDEDVEEIAEQAGALQALLRTVV